MTPRRASTPPRSTGQRPPTRGGPDEDPRSRPAPGGAGRYPGLEGLRAIAALMVVVHHASSVAGTGVSPLIQVPAGVFDGGVAVFFVLSGFLIYRPFAASRASGQPVPSIRAYALRRIGRLIPAYWLALSILWAMGTFDLGRDWWRYYLLLQPYSRETVLGGLVPAWSLSTELAFYAFVPFWARLLRRITPRVTIRADLGGCLALYLAGFTFRAAVSQVNPTWRGLSFQWLPANIDLFAIGMAVAVVATRHPVGTPWRRAIERSSVNAEILWASAAGLLTWYFLRVGAPDLTQLADPNGAYRGFYWQQRQLVLGAFSLLLLAPLVFGGSHGGLVRRLLRLRPVVWLGITSYGLYLWHLPIMEWAAGSSRRWRVPGPGSLVSTDGSGAFLYLFAAGLMIGSLVAWVSWTRVERPMQRWAARGAKRWP